MIDKMILSWILKKKNPVNTEAIKIAGKALRPQSTIAITRIPWGKKIIDATEEFKAK